MYHNPADDFSDETYSVALNICKYIAVNVDNKGNVSKIGYSTYVDALDLSSAGFENAVKIYCQPDCVVGVTQDNNPLIAINTNNISATKAVVVRRWMDIVDLITDDSDIWGLQSDGTVISTSSAPSGVKCKKMAFTSNVGAGQLYPIFLGNDGKVYNSSSNNPQNAKWSNVVDIAGNESMVVALLADGSVKCSSNLVNDELSTWSNIKKIYAPYCYYRYSAVQAALIIGIKNDNTLEVCAYNVDQASVGGWTDITAIRGDTVAVGVKSDGSFVKWLNGYDTYFTDLDEFQPKRIFLKSPDYECPTIANTDGMILSGM